MSTEELKIDTTGMETNSIVISERKYIPFIYQGSLIHASSKEWLNDNEITHVLTVLNENVTIPKTVKHLHIKVDDNGWLEDQNDDGDFMFWRRLGECFDFLREVADNENYKCLIHCSAGINRSVCVSAAWLMLENDILFDDALTRIKLSRPSAIPYKGMREQVEKYFEWLGSDTTETSVQDAKNIVESSGQVNTTESSVQANTISDQKSRFNLDRLTMISLLARDIRSSWLHSVKERAEAIRTLCDEIKRTDMSEWITDNMEDILFDGRHMRDCFDLYDAGDGKIEDDFVLSEYKGLFLYSFWVNGRTYHGSDDRDECNNPHCRDHPEREEEKEETS